MVGTGSANATATSAAKNNLNNDFSNKPELTCFFQTKLLINPKYLLVEDVLGNGCKKMIVGYTDRVIRMYSWSANGSSSLSTQQQLEMGTITFENSWELPDQIYAIKVFKDETAKKSILVSLPGGRVFHCKFSDTFSPPTDYASTCSLADLGSITNNTNTNKSTTNQPTEELINFFSELPSQSSSMPSYLVTNVQFNKCSQYSFLVTTNGDIFFFKMALNNLSRTPIWHRNLAGLVVMKYYKCDINKDGNEELLIATPEGQVFIVSCSGDSICLDLGEPVRAFHIGLYSAENQTVTSSSYSNLLENTTTTNTTTTTHRSEIDLSSNQAFDLALDLKRDDESLNLSHNAASNNSSSISSSSSSNTLCFVFWSSITNKICLLQIDAIITYSKLKPSSQLKYKCENVFSRSSNFSAKLNDLLDSSASSNLNNEVLHGILYQ
jgi:hypothetical protein